MINLKRVSKSKPALFYEYCKKLEGWFIPRYNLNIYLILYVYLLCIECTHYVLLIILYIKVIHIYIYIEKYKILIYNPVYNYYIVLSFC